MQHKTVTIHLANRTYDILIGSQLMQHIGAIISHRFRAKKVAIISDQNVANLWLECLKNSLSSHNIATSSILIPPGEQSKSFDCLEMVLEQLLAAKIERSDFIIAFGGGVVGDLTGFAAAILRRGCQFIQIPTSLLAQIDSSVGGKTGINTNHGKNLVGAFYQPQLVITDTSILNSLPLREFRSGYAEMAKYGLINQPDFFCWLEHNWRSIFNNGSERIEAIAKSCRFKADIVEQDEKEQNIRALLNLGHSFGHVLETITGYCSKRLNHGEAVSIGMILAYEFSAHLRYIEFDLVHRIRNHLHEVGLPTKLSDIPGVLPDADTFMEYLAQDKKMVQGHLVLILAKGLGQAFLAKNINPIEIRTFLDKKLKEIH